jgi:hypothetical protein
MRKTVKMALIDIDTFSGLGKIKDEGIADLFEPQ